MSMVVRLVFAEQNPRSTWALPLRQYENKYLSNENKPA